MLIATHCTLVTCGSKWVSVAVYRIRWISTQVCTHHLHMLFMPPQKEGGRERGREGRDATKTASPVKPRLPWLNANTTLTTRHTSTPKKLCDPGNALLHLCLKAQDGSHDVHDGGVDFLKVLKHFLLLLVQAGMMGQEPLTAGVCQSKLNSVTDTFQLMSMEFAVTASVPVSDQHHQLR